MNNFVKKVRWVLLNCRDTGYLAGGIEETRDIFKNREIEHDVYAKRITS